MRTQALVIADDPVYLNWLQNAAPGAEFSLARVSDVDDLVDRIHATGRVDVVFFEFSPATAAVRAALVEHLLERVPDIAVAGVGQDGDSATMLAAMRAGARDFFIVQRDDANVAALLSRLLRRSAPGATAGRAQGRVYGVMAALPGESIAFLGEHLALACAERLGKGERVLLLDVAIPAGAASIFLNLNQTYGVLDAINDGNRCDATLVDTAFSRHASGLYVLSLPEDFIGRPHIDGTELMQLLSVLRGLFACTVVAYDGHLGVDALRGLLGLADRSLMLTDQSILRSRHSKYLLRALRLDDCPLDRLGLVVDDYRKRVGLEPQNLSELLDLPVSATLSTQAANRTQAMNQGEPMFVCAPKDEYCAGVRQLAATLQAPRDATTGTSESGGGLLSRLFK
ncbi:AAA family ATPase [Panacagrimonas sp.]|uniref:AAA family ATPase n=1 Tax=Panacagrimonas sp. TaxID=2480088 RepID=UPI003B52F541